MRPEFLHQRQAVDLGHDQVLKDHGGLDPVGFFQRPGSITVVMEVDVGLAGNHTADGLADHRLVVDEQDHYLVLGQNGITAHYAGSWRLKSTASRS